VKVCDSPKGIAFEGLQKLCGGESKKLGILNMHDQHEKTVPLNAMQILLYGHAFIYV
jgi:hypothetical protein